MTIDDIMTALRQPVPQALLKDKVSQGTKITFLPWYGAVALADARTGGRWSHELVEHWTDDALRGSKTGGYNETALAHVRVRVTIHGDDRSVSREAIGVDDEPTGQRGTPLERAEAAGLRRALAKFGLGLHLYGGADAHADAPVAQPAKAAAVPAEALDMLAAIEGAATEDELRGLGPAIKMLPPKAQQALRDPFGRRLAALRGDV